MDVPERPPTRGRAGLAAAAVEPGAIGVVVGVVGGIVLVAGLVALFTTRAAAPTATALVIGGLLLGCGAFFAVERRTPAALQGSVWQALVAETNVQAQLAASSVPAPLRPVLHDLALGNAAHRYVEITATLQRGLHTQVAVDAGHRSPADTIGAVLAEVATAAVDDAHRAVSMLASATPPPIDLRAPSDETTVLPPVTGPTPTADLD